MSERSFDMTDGEKKLLTALVKMVDQYLHESDDLVESRSMSSGEHAIAAPTDYGLLATIDPRFGQWNEAGQRFRREARH